MQINEWKAKGNHFKYGSHTVFYLDEGQNEGEIVVCIHGFPTSSWDWHWMWPELTSRFRVIAPDMLGFGYSDKPPEDVYTIQYQATLHETLLRCLDIKRVHILAHDYGASITQELLARYEDRKKSNQAGLEIVSICFLNAGLFPETHQALFIQKLLMSPLGSFLGRFISEDSFSKNFISVFGKKTKPSPAEVKIYWEQLNHNDGLKASHKIIRYIEERKKQRSRWVGAMQVTQVPMRLINGPDDPVSGRHMAERYRELIANADIIFLEGIGHYPQLEDPDGVLKWFLQFVNKIIVRQQTLLTED